MVINTKYPSVSLSLTRQVLEAVFILPAAGLDVGELVGELVVRGRMMLRYGQVLLCWRHL